MENVTLNPKEQTRLQVLNSLLAEHMMLDQAATLMGVSPRHTRRILAPYREKGAAALAHGHRGRKAPNATPESVATDVVHLARTRYAGANHTHLSELLSEGDGIDICRTTRRRILVNAGLSSPRRRRPPKHRVRRERMPQEGMLLQVDGSHHPWLEERGPRLVLLLAVDDATGTVVDALFCEQEDAHNYFLLIQGLIERCGIPVSLYTDRHGVFRHTPGSGLPGMPTQFSRAMGELRVQMIFARSPQAKGRVERTAGTFQDRLVTELRLADAGSIVEANRALEQFLPRFNQRVGVTPPYPEPAFRPLDPELCLEQVLCFKHNRRVARDNTVRFQLHTLQLLPGPERPSYAGAGCGGPGRAGRTAVGTTRGMHHSCPGGATQSDISPKRPQAVRTCSCPALRRQRPGRTLDGGSRTIGLKGREREGSRGQHCQPGHSRQAQSRLSAQADVPSEGEMEGDSESPAQGDVASGN